MTILSDLLTALGVPHTVWYADQCFDGMTFKSLFGFTKALDTYGVASEGYLLADKAADLPLLTPPFLAHTPAGFVIVLDVKDNQVSLNTFNGPTTMPTADFLDKWDGNVLLVFPSADATEPDYDEHRFTEIANKSKRWILGVLLVGIFAFAFAKSGLWHNVSTIMLTAITLVGIYITYELLLKSYGIHSEHGDSICGIIDRNGCHTVLGTSAAKFFGIFGWSEVGFAYFTITLLVLLLFPGQTGSLALINACCCPFSFWSVWYQKYRAKAWCTLCLITQACLWLSLACYFFGGHFSTAWPPTGATIIIGAAYAAMLLIINSLSPFFDRNEKS